MLKERILTEHCVVVLADKLEEAVPRFYVLGERLDCEIFKLYIMLTSKFLLFMNTSTSG
jgi:hypothetical protein